MNKVSACYEKIKRVVKFKMIVYSFIVIEAPNREGAPDWPDFMYSGKFFPTGLLNI